MGLISTLLVDGVLLTSILAGVRRTTGWSAYNAFESKIASPMGRVALRKYLEAGEWCVDKGKVVMNKLTTQGNMPSGSAQASSSSAIGDGFTTPPGRSKNQWGF